MSEPEIFEHLRGVFFEESNEGLATMESCLIAFDEGTYDNETLHSIFRAVHSIKGAAGGFGFEDITKFSHAMESLLDEVRAGERGVDAQLVDVLLKSVDHLKVLLEAAANNSEADEDVSSALIKDLSALSARNSPSVVHSEETDGSRSLYIAFKPLPNLFTAGSDPILIFKELASMGELHVRPKLKRLPELAEFDPKELYISWELTLDTETEPSAVRSVFDWVSDHCELEVTVLTELWDDTPDEPPPEAQEPKGIIAPPPSPKETTSNSGGPQSRKKPKSSASIRVSTDKIDALMDIVGELVITQSMLSIDDDFSPERIGQLRDSLAELSRQTRELQESVMRVRMVPIGAVFSRFPRLVRDVRSTLAKQVELQLLGESTEVDKTVSEQLADPLVHLVRNALDHGLEAPEDRQAADKDPTGSLTLSARHEGGNIIIDIIDDGRGINGQRVIDKARSKGLIEANEHIADDQVYDLLFLPGFSTAEKVSSLSGRGVGLDVVARNIKNIGGSIKISSQLGEGTCFSIRIPMTLSILDAQLIRLVDQVFIVPLLSIVESVLIQPSSIHVLAGKQEVFRLRDEYIPVIRSSDVLGVERKETDTHPRLLMVLEDQDKKAGILVDDLLEQQQVVIKSLETNYHPVPGLSGATILGDGKVAYIIDVPGFFALAARQTSNLDTSALATELGVSSNASAWP